MEILGGEIVERALVELERRLELQIVEHLLVVAENLERACTRHPVDDLHEGAFDALFLGEALADRAFAAGEEILLVGAGAVVDDLGAFEAFEAGRILAAGKVGGDGICRNQNGGSETRQPHRDHDASPLIIGDDLLRRARAASRSRHAKACSAGSRADAMLPTARRRLNDLRDQTLRHHLVKVGLGNFCRMPPDPADLDPAGSPEASSHTVGFAQAGNRYPPSGGSPRAGFSESTLPERAIQLTPFLLARAKRLHLLGLGFELARKRPVGFSRVSEVFLVTRPP